MSITLQIFVIIAGVVLILLVLRDTTHWKMTEKQSLFWIFSGVVLILTGIFPSLAVIPAIFFGVDYAPSIIFAIAILLLMYGVYRCYVTNAALLRQVTELTEYVSLLQHELSNLQQAPETKEAVHREKDFVCH